VGLRSQPDIVDYQLPIKHNAPLGLPNTTGESDYSEIQIPSMHELHLAYKV